MNQIMHCDWLPEQARWRYLAHSELPAVSCKKNSPKAIIVLPIVWLSWLDVGPRKKKNLAYVRPSGKNKPVYFKLSQTSRQRWPGQSFSISGASVVLHACARRLVRGSNAVESIWCTAGKWES